ncbi:type III-D CRISPR-associated protein Csx19, partial [Streptomyces lancefieldiae]
MTTLHARAAQGVTLAEALTATAFPTAVALLSAPHAHTVAHVTEGRCRTRQADPYDLSTVFEARVFDGERELRWLCDSGDRGRAVLLTEDETLLPDAFPEPVAPLPATAVLAAHYLLWGRPAGGDEGWTVLHTPRIGS